MGMVAETATKGVSRSSMFSAKVAFVGDHFGFLSTPGGNVYVPKAHLGIFPWFPF